MQSAILRPLAAVGQGSPAVVVAASVPGPLSPGRPRPRLGGLLSPETNGGQEDGESPIAGGPRSSHVGRQSYAFLKQKSADTAESENCEEAAEIRGTLRNLEDGEPVLRLKRLL